MKETTEKKEYIETTEAEKPYNFRRLYAKDIFPMTTIIKKIGLKEFIKFFEGDGINKIMSAFAAKKADDQSTDEKSVEALGVSIALELADIIFNNLEKCESDIFSLLAQTSDLSVKQVEKLDLAVFAEMVIDFFKKDDFKDFFKVVSRSFK